MKPTWRKPAGVLALLAGITVYAVVVVRMIEPIGQWPVWVQLPIYIVLGVAWLLPLRRFLIWMETGRFR